MSTQKKQTKSLNKIHRRTKQQIQKEFICPQGCGKAYGSYAALYTHMKNKHANAKLPQMKQQTIVKGKTGKKGRPQAKQFVSTLKQSSHQKEPECKLCHRSDCVCIDDYDTNQKNKVIEIMANQDFIMFINEVGNLSVEDKFTWVRNTEEQFVFLQEDDIQKMIRNFNKDYKEQLKFPHKFIEFLSFSSRYWDSKLINQLYVSLFVIRTKKGKKQIIDTFEKNKTFFANMIECANTKKQQFEQLCNFMKII